MAKLNVIKRIIKEDFKPEDQELVDKLSFPINQFMEQVANALSKNLTIEDNLPFDIKTIKVTVDANGVPTESAAFKSSVKPRGLVVMSATNIQDGALLTGAPFVQWSIDNGTVNNGLVTVLLVTGLPANTQFSLTIMAIS